MPLRVEKRAACDPPTDRSERKGEKKARLSTQKGAISDIAVKPMLGNAAKNFS